MLAPRRITALLALSVLIPAAGRAQTVPNLSGTWVLAVDQSDFGAMPGPTARTDIIDHQEPKLTIKRTVGEVNLDLTYGVDGKVWKNTTPQGEVSSTLKWEGQALVISSSISVQGNEVAITDRLTLSADGKTLTQARTLSVQGQEIAQRLVFARK